MSDGCDTGKGIAMDRLSLRQSSKPCRAQNYVGLKAAAHAVV